MIHSVYRNVSGIAKALPQYLDIRHSKCCTIGPGVTMAHVRDNFLCGKEKSQDVLRAPLGHHNNGDGCPGDGWEMKLQGLF